MQDDTVLVITKETARRAYRTEPIYQYDVGHKLQLAGFDGLPDVFQVHFAHSPMGDSITQIGQDGVVDVPDMYAQTAAPIYAWVYVAEAESGLTKYQIEIPVQRRARITDQEPTPVERSTIDQEIAALNAGVERSEAAADAAAESEARILEAERRIETETSDLRNDFDDLGLSVVDGEINITFEEEAGE